MKAILGCNSVVLGALSMLMASASTAVSNDTITVATYGGEWGAAMQSCIIDPFSAATKITVVPEPGVSSVTLSKLRQQRGSPAIDAIWLDGGVSELASAEGVLADIEPSRVPSVESIIPQAVYRTQDGAIFAVGTGYYSLGIAYKSDEVGTPPKSWNDLWQAEYAGVVAVPSPANGMGVPFIAHIATINGGSADDVTPAVKKLQELDVAAYFDTSGAASNLFQRGEIVIGAQYSNSAFAMRDQGLPVEFAIPEEGAVGGDIRLHLVKDSPKLPLAEKFLDFALQKEQAGCMAEKIYVGPSTVGVTLSEKAKQRMPWGESGSIDNLSLPNWVEINQNRSAITERFNKEVVSGK